MLNIEAISTRNNSVGRQGQLYKISLRHGKILVKKIRKVFSYYLYVNASYRNLTTGDLFGLIVQDDT